MGFFDPSAVYRVTYTMLDPTLAAPINGTVAANLRGTVSDLVKDVGDVQRRLSVVETRKAEKDAAIVPWINSTTLNGWVRHSDADPGFSYFKEGNVVYFEAVLKSGATAVGTEISVFIDGYRPDLTQRFTCYSSNGTNNASGLVELSPNGSVKIGGANGTFYNALLTVRGSFKVKG
ncbi:hypothetical protein ABEX25_25750 [Paenibacillus thiaminolyticus]|uniref:hypothetical protein n=1 Tax=Paenibacillus thiaminolyticus TaxID=49283 RepID=UPI003D2881F5